MSFCTGGTSLFYFITFHKKRTYLLVFYLVFVFLPRKDQKEKYLILGGFTLFRLPKNRKRLTFQICFKKIIMKIDQLEVEVPGSKWNLLLPGTSSGQ